MKIIFSEPAKADLKANYHLLLLKGVPKTKAKRVLKALKARIDVLVTLPFLGRMIESPLHSEEKFRQLVLGKYLVIYLVIDKVIIIQRIFDSSQNPSRLVL